MRIVRALFIASYRISHACLSLRFDQYIKNIDQTYVFTHCVPEYLDGILKSHGVDTDNFVYVTDAEMDARYPTMRNWWFDDDPRGSWLYQQALKIASVDYIDADVVLIQDPDTFCIRPYQCLTDNNELKLFILPNETHSYGYYSVLENSLGIKRQTPHCFVSEFMPVFKEDWQSMKHTLETRNNKNWADAIIDGVPVEQGLRWFSEYEFLGNWAMTQRPVTMAEQVRFQYKTLDELDNLTSDYNCVCDAIPKLADSLILENNRVIDYDKIFNKVSKFL